MITQFLIFLYAHSILAIAICTTQRIRALDSRSEMLRGLLRMLFALLAMYWLWAWARTTWWWPLIPVIVIGHLSPGFDDRLEQSPSRPGDWFAHRALLAAVIVMAGFCMRAAII